MTPKYTTAWSENERATYFLWNIYTTAAANDSCVLEQGHWNLPFVSMINKFKLHICLEFQYLASVLLTAINQRA